MSRKEKLKELLVDENEVFEQIIDKVKQLIGINKTDGSIVFKIDQENLTDHQAILLYLLGAKFAFDLELREYPEVSNQELADFLNRDPNAIGSRISELKKERKVTSPERGKHIVKPLIIKNDIDEIVQKGENLRK